MLVSYFKMLTMGISTYSEVKNIISVKNNVNISIHSSEINSNVHKCTSVVNELKNFSTRAILRLSRNYLKYQI